LGVYGVRRSVTFLPHVLPLPGMALIGTGFTIAVFGAAVVMHLAQWSSARRDYYSAVRYVEDRHVAAARWVRNKTAGDATIATHTIGTMGYYGQRRLIDVTGVVTPAMIPSIGNLLHLETYLKGMRANYLVTLRERFEVVNANPLFTSDAKTPEVMEVFAYTPGRTHIMPQRASALNRQASQYMASRMDADALPLLQQSYEFDRNSSRTCTLLGVAMLNLGDTARAMEALGKALRLQPDYGPAMVPFGDVSASRKDYTTALAMLRNAVRLMPASKLAVDAFNRVSQRQLEDSLAALGFKRVRYTD
jgi:tetratricopeptide (TPR) repeat protein